MEMNINITLVVKERRARAWSQQQLADISSLSLRTIQRIEKSGVSSKDSLQAISSAFEKKPLFFLNLNEKNVPRKGINKAAAIIFSIFSVSFGIFYLTQASAETVMLNIEYKSENTSTHDVSKGRWDYRATIGRGSELSLPNNFVLMIHPKNSSGEGITLDVVLKSNIEENLMPNYALPRVTGNLNDGINVKFKKEGEVFVNITINATE